MYDQTISSNLTTIFNKYNTESRGGGENKDIIKLMNKNIT